MLHIYSCMLSICQARMAALSPLPQGLGHVDPGWAHRLESALCLSPPSHFNCPPAGYVSGPDRLPDSGIYLAYWGGKRHQATTKAGTNPLLFFQWSCLPFIMTGTSDSVLPITPQHISLLLQGAQHYHTMLSYPREDTDAQRVRGNLQMQISTSIHF